MGRLYIAARRSTVDSCAGEVVAVGDGVKRVVVLMEHTAKGGAHKILPACDLPLTGLGVVDRIITDLGVLDVTEQGLKLVELAEGVSFEELQEATGCPIQR